MFDGSEGRLTAELSARCRKCTGCLAYRRVLWTARAMDEVAAANRTWFGTLTFSPESQFIIKCRAELAVQRRRREPFSSLRPSEQFVELCRYSNEEVTKFLKRVRKNSGVPLRYLLVSEAHKSGRPHHHVLLHEPGEPVRKATLEAAWQKLGFSKFKLVDRDRGSAAYVCKYLSKDAQTRVRASQHYGRAYYVRALSERVVEVTRELVGREGTGGPTDERKSPPTPQGTPCEK